MMKYPHTPYLTNSPEVCNIDKETRKSRVWAHTSDFMGKALLFTVKMDGSNVALDNDTVVSRCGWHADHKSYDLLKSIHATKLKNRLPENLQLFGEWLYAKHSIHYVDQLKLRDYLMIFQIYDRERKIFLSWYDLTDICFEYELLPVPFVRKLVPRKERELLESVLADGTKVINDGHEGLVIRNMDAFNCDRFPNNVAKYVRKGHVQTNTHWSHERIVRNQVLSD